VPSKVTKHVLTNAASGRRIMLDLGFCGAMAAEASSGKLEHGPKDGRVAGYDSMPCGDGASIREPRSAKANDELSLTYQLVPREGEKEPVICTCALRMLLP
jgi:hypothetical protein